MQTTTQNSDQSASAEPSALAAAIQLIQRSQRVAVVCHITPDPDAIGSLLGLGILLRDLGKEVTLLCDDPVPRSLQFLPGANSVLAGLPNGLSPDVLIAVDSSDAERLGKVVVPLLASGIDVLVIDHHITNLAYGKVNLVNPRWSSAAEGVVELARALGAVLSPEAAACLLTGVVGDTRSFSTASTTPDSLRTAATLIEAGADIQSITELVFSRKSADVLRLWGLGLHNIQIDGGIIWSIIPFEERVRLGVQDTNGSGLSNVLISAEEANIAAVFTEQPDQSIDASFRARPGYDVAAVALSLGGGGHALAAGAKLKGPLEETARKVVGLLKLASSADSVESGG